MTRKLLKLFGTIAVLASLVPATASAAEATYPAGTRAPVGQSITLTGKDFALTSANLGPIRCERFNLNIKVIQNDGTTVKASGPTFNPAQTFCYDIEPSRPANFGEFNVTELSATEANGPSGSKKNGTMSFTVTVSLPASVVCKFTGTNVPYTYVSTASPATLTFSKAGGITSTGGCGSATLDGVFSLEGYGTTTPVVLH